MRKIRFLILAAALLCGIISAGCADSGADETLPETQESTAEETQALRETFDMYRIIYPQYCNKSVQAEIENFQRALKNQFGTDMQAFPDTEAETELEIVVGKAEREGSDIGAYEKGYLSYGIKISGKKIFVYYTDEDYIGKAFGLLRASLSTEDGKVIAAMQDRDSCAVAELNNLPVYGDGSCDDIMCTGEGTYQVSVPMTNEEEYSAYLNLLEEKGYKKYTENTVSNNLFATYINDKYEINTAYYGSGKRTRIIFEPLGYLPDTETPEYTKVCDAAVAQMKLKLSGLSMVVTLEDGRFVIIDGGSDSDVDANTVYNYIMERTPAGEKPHVIWIFTHAHTDHVTVPIKLMTNHAKDICVDLFVCNFPDFTESEYDALAETAGSIAKTTSNANAVLSLAAVNYKDTPVFRCHPGQKLLLPGCEIQFLMNHENTGIRKYSWINSTSLVFRMTLGKEGKSLLVMGDQEPGSLCDTLNALYGSYLKSDMLQVSHHGYSGGSLKLYTTVSPSVCFWPVTHDLFDSFRRKGYSDDGTIITNEGLYFLRSQLQGVTHYDCGETVTVTCP